MVDRASPGVQFFRLLPALLLTCHVTWGQLFLSVLKSEMKTLFTGKGHSCGDVFFRDGEINLKERSFP